MSNAMFKQDVDPAVEEARTRLRTLGVDRFNSSRLAQLFLALEDPSSMRFYIPDDEKSQIRVDIIKIMRAKTAAVLREELKYASNEFLDFCYQLSGKKSNNNKKKKRPYKTFNKWDIPLFIGNEQVGDLLLARAPRRPYCGDELSWTSPRDLDVAMSRRYIQLNPPDLCSFIIIDCDYVDAANAWKAANLPPPTWVTTNPESKHGHVVYALKAPVWKGGDNQRPARYFNSVAEAYRVALDGDINYAGLLTQNPLHPDWIVSSESCYKMYDLADLAGYIDLTKAVPKRMVKKKVRNSKIDVIGRNCLLFDTARSWAYTQVKNYSDRESFRHSVFNHINYLNSTLPDPLSYKEIKQIANSIAKWTWKNLHGKPGKTSLALSLRQTELGRRSGDARRKKSGRLDAAMERAVAALSVGESQRSRRGMSVRKR